MLQSLSCMTLNSITVTRLNFFVHVIDLKKKVFCIFLGFSLRITRYQLGTKENLFANEWVALCSYDQRKIVLKDDFQ